MQIRIIIAILFLSYISALAQVENYEYSAAKPGIIDTMAVQTSQKMVNKAEGLLEKEIDPEKYLLGPGDVFKISVITSKTKRYNLAISPAGKIMIPDVGIVDLKGKTLAEGEKAIVNKMRRIFRTDNIFVILYDIRKFKVSVSGAVKKAAIVPATAVDRVSEIIEKAGGLKPDGSLRKIKIYRSGLSKPINVDLIKYFKVGYDDANPTVLGGDRIIVPKVSEQLTIAIRGEVPFPGEYEFVRGDSLSTLIKFANGFFDTSFLDSVEYTSILPNGSLETRYLDLRDWRDKLFSNELLPGDFPLNNGDRVYIRKNPRLRTPQEVIIKGEVLYPGKYPIDGITTRVADVMRAAGGLTEKGSLEATILIRQAEIGAEDPEMDRLRRIPPGEMSESEYKYFQARLNEKVGVMAISFPKLMADYNSEDNIILQNRDSIIVPEKKYFVNVQGRVNNPGLVVYKPDYNYLDYINAAGGFGFRSDEGATMIVKSKGQQFDAEEMNYTIAPGDYILVPPKKDIGWGQIAMTTLTVVAQIVAIGGVIIALTR